MHSIACLFFIFQAQNNKKTSKKTKVGRTDTIVFCIFVAFQVPNDSIFQKTSNQFVPENPKTRKDGNDNIRPILNFLGVKYKFTVCHETHFLLCAATSHYSTSIPLLILLRMAGAVITCRLIIMKDFFFFCFLCVIISERFFCPISNFNDQSNHIEI